MNNFCCKICESSNLKCVYNIYDDRYAYKELFDLYECQNCEHKFLNHSLTDFDLTKLYTDYYPRKNLNVDDYKPHTFTRSFKSWLNGEKAASHTYVPKDVKILDIGCGFGEAIGYHQNRNCEAYGIEADSNVKKVIDKFGLNIKIGLFNKDLFAKSYFDYVTMDQVLEHSIDPIETLNGINHVLKVNGYLVISIPNANSLSANLFKKRWINWHTPYHLQFFSKKSIALLANNTGFNIESINTITSSEWFYYQWLHLFLAGSESEKSVFWDAERSRKRNIPEKIVSKIITIAHKTKVNHLTTRLLDSIGKGDNFVVILKKVR